MNNTLQTATNRQGSNLAIGNTDIVDRIRIAIGCHAGALRLLSAPPPPDVSVALPVQRDVVEWDTYTGHLMSPEMANVVARVSGLIMEMPFEEGAMVKRGHVC